MTNEDPNNLENNQRQPLGETELIQLRSLLKGLQFGSATIIIQDGCIVQIDRTEKRRLRSRRSSTPTNDE